MDWKVNLFNLVTASTKEETSLPNIFSKSFKVKSVSSTVSCNKAATNVFGPASSSAKIRATATGCVI